MSEHEDVGARIQTGATVDSLTASTADERATHTPGPWHYVPRTQFANGHVEGIWGPDEQEIVVTDGGYYPPTIADARLITAAPDLLQACRDVLELFPEGDLDYRAPRLCRRLKTAIRKAERGL